MRVFKIARPAVITERPTTKDKNALALWMRNNPTPAEQIMIDLLVSNQIPFKFQVVMFGYIPDFYFTKAKSIIEIDGEIHKFQQAYDRNRDQVFMDKGIRVLRISNRRLTDSPQAVIDDVKRYLANGQRVPSKNAIRRRKRTNKRKRDRTIPKVI